MLAWAMGIAFTGSTYAPAAHAQSTILNVSYDPTREFFKDFDALFVAHWQKTTGQKLKILASHGGSGKQARSVIDGLPADVVTLALSYDIDAIAIRSGRIAENWRERLPYASVPSYSTILFLVRKGNPKKIQNWNDLVRQDVVVTAPNPKTSGGARWIYLAAWVWAKKTFGTDEARVRQFVGQLYRQVPVLDAAARAATTTFAQREIGDVLLTWESEAYLALEAFPDQFEMVAPTISIKADTPVAVVDKIVDRRGSRAIAEAYLKFLYTPEAQELAANHHYRPSDPAIAAKFNDRFAQIELFDVEAAFGGWERAHQAHFADGGIFDQIYLGRDAQ